MRVSTVLIKAALISFVIILAILPYRNFSQTTGSIGGTVVDANDNKTPIQGAYIHIEGTSKGAESDANGNYIILNVEVGTWTVICKYLGYNEYKQEQVKVYVDTKTALNFALTTKDITTKEIIIVDVKRPIIDITSPEDRKNILKETIDNEGIRGIQNIVGKQSGVVEDPKGNALNIRGGRSSENLIIVDGVETNDPTSGNSSAFVSNSQLQEIAVLTGGFGAEYGNALAGVINVTTRSGQSKYTGGLEVISDVLAGKWIKTNSQGYNLYNLTLGGPLIPIKSMEKVINFYGGVERQFLQNGYPSWINDQHFSDGIIPNLDLKLWSFNGKLNINLDQIGVTDEHPKASIPIVLKGGFTYTDTKTSDYNGGFLKYDNQRWRYDYKKDISGYGRISHNVSSKFFYELQGSYYKTQTEFGDPLFRDNYFWVGDTNHVPGLHTQGSELPFDPTGIFRVAGAPYNFYHKNESSYIGGKLDATYDILSDKYGKHDIKFGGELKYNTLKKMEFYTPAVAQSNYANLDTSIDIHSQKFIDAQRQLWYSGSGARFKGYGYSISDQFGNQIITGDDINPRHPIIGAFYLRDKIDFGKPNSKVPEFSFNGGIRIDYLDVNTEVLKDINNVLGPDGVLLSNDDYQKSKPDIIISPRLGFSFPITDKTVFIAQFGKFVQMPPLDYLYTNRLAFQQFFATSLQDVVENSSLKPERLTSYEVGIKQNFGDILDFSTTVYYRETQDQIGAIRVLASPTVPVGYSIYGNSDFSVSRGMDVILSLRRFQRIAIDLSYTLLYASGTGSTPTEKFNLVNQQTVYPNFTFPLDYDQRHTGALDIDYRFGDEISDPQMPKGFWGSILRNLGLNVLFSFNSGRPYTARELPAQSLSPSSGTALSPKNSVYSDWNFSIDLKLDKTVPIWKTNWNFYVYVTNLLNSQLIEAVWESTGRPDDDGFLNTPQGQVGYSIPGYVDNYRLRIGSPNNWGPPRQVRFGVKVNF